MYLPMFAITAFCYIVNFWFGFVVMIYFIYILMDK